MQVIIPLAGKGTRLRPHTHLVPKPLLYPAEKPARFGAIFYGSTSPAMQEALDVLAERGIYINALRVRGFPFQEEISDFVASHPWVFVVEQNRDAQLKTLELSIVQQVRQATRAVQSNFQRVQSTKVARELAEKRLEAQQKRFDVGLCTLFELTQAQRDVVLQRNNELNAVISYNQSLVDFQLVQVAPLGGGF